MVTLVDRSADEKHWISSPIGNDGAIARLMQLTQPSPTVVRRVELVVAAVFVALAAALTSAILILDLRAGDILTMAQALIASAVFTLGGGAIFLWLTAGSQWNRLTVRLAITYGLGTLLIVVNVLIAASALFASGRDLTFLAIVLLYATAIAGIFAYLVSSSLDDSVRTLARSARLMTTGDLGTRVPVVPERELTELGAALNAMAVRLEAATKRRHELEESQRALITAISEELSAPLSSLRVMIESINDGVALDPATLRQCTKAMDRESKRIGRLVNGLVELARIDAGQSKLRMQPHAIDAVIREVAEAQSANALVRDVAIELSALDGLPAALIDPEFMYRALRILVEHGIGRTPARGTLAVNVGDRGSALQVDIRAGIAPALDWLGRFDRVRLDDRPGKDEGRAIDELGLSLAKRIIEMHGGHYWASHAPDGGATYSFTVPKSTQAPG